MMRIAVTGGIGAGKSEVMKILKSLGASVILADEINRELLDDPGYIKKIGELFPSAVKGGKIDKAALKNIVFSDGEQRRKLNSAAHPIIKERIIKKAAEIKGDVYVEVPILLESGMLDIFDKVWYVSANEDIRIGRVKERDGISPDLIRAIIEAQKGEESLKNLADEVIDNSGTVGDLKNSVAGLYNRII